MLLNFAGALLSEDKLRLIFENSVASKPTATSGEGRGSFWKLYHETRKTESPCVLPLDEPDIYNYACYLRVSKPAPTSERSFLQSLALVVSLSRCGQAKNCHFLFCSGWTLCKGHDERETPVQANCAPDN